MAAAPILPGEATADLCDRLGAQARVCHLPWRSYGRLQATSASIACVQAFEDAGPVRALLDTPGRGRILLVDAGGLLRVAVLGERMAQLGLANGWRGVIVHGAVRDVAALAALDFAVLALGAVPQRANPQAPAETRHCALALGGVEISDGDWVALDADGLVFVRAS
ncbi:ribonuclease E activity regulator RraA [Acidovorax sp. CCYZU-2555]|uniref:ribonuclease E activity regulator RraA n=1 Tax=Acidovorax sp. CCYZU-2555 TaxID=2835042 RepID=UPI001BCD998D|nr:ribonuclease E activity regulator RraA [Acidovorax sp. CCYZU-2555]MBS7777523.1 ribonuclease E activity regulator RraA [Acidovorax sp. CCYZU-2555]